MFSTAALSLHMFSITNYIISLSYQSLVSHRQKASRSILLSSPLHYPFWWILVSSESYCSVDIFPFNSISKIKRSIWTQWGGEKMKVKEKKLTFLLTLIFIPCKWSWVFRIPSKLLIFSLYKLCVTIFYFFHDRLRRILNMILFIREMSLK